MKDIYQTALFRREGFERRQCQSCGRTFWTLKSGRKTCGDTPCDEYTFINNSPTKRKYSLAEMERAFLKFFKRRGHRVVKRYPVVARWRDDIFLTIASIADFQPWVTSGLVPPPANPLVVSQPSIRLKDIDNVGRSGRHFTLFFMGGHHAFNSRRQRVYWNDETVALCHEFLTKELGIPPDEVTYIQDFWEGGGNAGEDFEVNVRGLELATLVFMQYTSEDGKYMPLPMKIVDTGYGLERLAWISQGSASSYEAIFGHVVEQLCSLAGIGMPPADILEQNSKLAGLMDIETGRDLLTLRKKVAARTDVSVEELDKLLGPLEAVYAIADHLRCLAFMFGDGITPSNVKEGYLARVVLRRTLRLMRELGLRKPLAELMALGLKQLERQFPELGKRESYIIEVIGLEERRYRDAISRGSKLVERLAEGLRAEGKPLSSEKLIELYDSHGLPPDIVKEVAGKVGVMVEVPEDFYIQVAKSHSQARHVPAAVAPVPKEKLRRLPPTKALYYRDPYAQEFKARVLRCLDAYVVLDRTAFYPEGGGQPSDIGSLEGRRGRGEVLDVRKAGDVILHRVRPNPFKVGQHVRGKIDWGRRSSLMRHHTGTHILLGAARRVLGDHVWQHGVQKGVERTRLDISHFKRIEPKELREIERLANAVVMEDRLVGTSWMDRNEAERKYGFDLYQGGVVPGRKVRVVEVEGWNAQACAGTHCSRTGEVGFIKIARTERIQDGVERLEFVVGDSALKFVQAQGRQLAKAAEILRTSPERVATATQRLFEEWKAVQKELDRLRGRLAELRLIELRSKAKQVGKVRAICEEIEGASADELIKVASALTREDKGLVVVLGARDAMGKLVAMAGEEAVNAGADCGGIAAEAARVLGGGGGGKPELGQGGGPKADLLIAALKRALELCEKQQAQG
jgi:alanyl-tRNA synthetase